MNSQEEQTVQYAPKDEKLKKERTRKFKKRAVIAGAVVGLSALLTNTLPIVEAISGERGVSEVSRYFPMVRTSLDIINPPRIFSLKFIFRDTLYNSLVQHIDGPAFYLFFEKCAITNRDESGYSAQRVYDAKKVINRAYYDKGFKEK